MYSICERRMKKTIIVEAVAILSLALILVLGTVTPFFKVENVYAQAANQQQRLGTSNILEFPDVHIVPATGKTTLLDLQFALSGNNTAATNTTNPAVQDSSTVVAFKNPDYGLNNSTNTPKLSIGQSFRINSTNSGAVPYSNVNVKLVPILPTTDPTADDPESMILGQPIDLGSYLGNIGNFTIPHSVQPGKDILYVYVQYPFLHATGIYNGQVVLMKQQSTATTAAPLSQTATNSHTSGGGKITTTPPITNNNVNATTNTTTSKH
jgi:hypothetical protein